MPKQKNDKTEDMVVVSPSGEYEALSRQCIAEYDLAWKNQKPKKDEWEIRLKLYNNQKRDKTAVGDTTLFTVTQTILASLYNDRLSVTFEGREDGDEEIAEKSKNAKAKE